MPPTTARTPTMKAAILAGDAPELVIEAVPVPAPKAGEALVKLAACGVCHTDLHVIKGEVGFPRPAVLGHEISGVVAALGEPASGSPAICVGDAVAGAFIMPCTRCDACRKGRDDLCGPFFAQNRLNGTLYDGASRLSMPDGSFLAMYSMAGLAEYCVVPTPALARLAPAMDTEAACVLGCAGLTSYGAVFRAGQVEAGESMAIIGVGGVGSSLIQMGRAARAATIVAVDISDAKLARARELGATHTVNSREAGDPAEAVRAACHGGADVAFEALGNPATFGQAVRMLADGGRMVAIGIAAGASAAEVEITPLVRRGYTIRGSFGGRTRTDLPAVTDLAVTGAFDPGQLITRRFPLDEANEAYQALARGEIVGRAIITMGPAPAGR